MNEQEHLKLQSYLDGELSGRERNEVAHLLDERDDARELLAELQHTRAALRDGEEGHGLDCSREFYWNRINREIGMLEQEPAPPVGAGVIAWLRRHVAQVAGATAAVGLLIVSITVSGTRSPATAPVAESEWEVFHPGTTMVNYRDYKNGLTVVMLYDRNSAGFTSGD